MSKSMKVKIKLADGWHNMRADDLAGKTTKEFLLSLDGQDAVAEFAKDGEATCYAVGTMGVRILMEGKGKPVLTFAEAVAGMEKAGSELLTVWDDPMIRHAATVFPGATISDGTVEDNTAAVEKMKEAHALAMSAKMPRDIWSAAMVDWDRVRWLHANAEAEAHRGDFEKANSYLSQVESIIHVGT